MPERPPLARLHDPLAFGFISDEDRRAFGRGPWRWPVAPDQIKRARDKLGIEPPALALGQVVLLTVGEDSAGLWMFPAPVPGDPYASPFKNTPAVWAHAPALLARVLPLVWASLTEAHAQTRMWAAPIGLLPRVGCQATVEPLSGPSFGLSLLISLASRTFGIAARGDTVASAAVDVSGADPYGKVERVGCISEKVTVALRLSPRLRRFLVAAGDEDEARAACAKEGVEAEIIPIKRVIEGLLEALEQAPHERLIASASGSGSREEIVQSLFRIAVRGRKELVDWTGVAAAARLALESWVAQVTEGQQGLLRFALAVAERHENNRGTLPLPDPEWLSGIRAPLRFEVLAHFVQQATDTGEPSPDEMEAFAGTYLPKPEHRFAPHLKLLGSLGRLRDVQGYPRRALQLQEEAAAEWLEWEEPAELSYPLAECLRLSGVLGDREAFDQADVWRLRAESLGGFGKTGSLFVRLARCRAHILLFGPGNSEVLDQLRELATDRNIEAHVRWSAQRWLIRCLDAGAAGDEATLRVEELKLTADSAGNDARTAQKYASLVNLDRALAASDDDTARTAVVSMLKLEPGLVSNLLRSVPEVDQPPLLALRYPY